MKDKAERIIEKGKQELNDTKDKNRTAFQVASDYVKATLHKAK